MPPPQPLRSTASPAVARVARRAAGATRARARSFRGPARRHRRVARAGRGRSRGRLDADRAGSDGAGGGRGSLAWTCARSPTRFFRSATTSRWTVRSCAAPRTRAGFDVVRWSARRNRRRSHWRSPIASWRAPGPAAPVRIPGRHERPGAPAPRGAHRPQRVSRARRAVRGRRASKRVSVAVARVRRSGERRLPEPSGYALGKAHIRVMHLAAMARVTRLPLEELQRLAKESPVFAPGAENYARMGALAAIWPEPSSALVEDALAELLRDAGSRADARIAAGRERGGRVLAEPTADAVARRVAARRCHARGATTGSTCGRQARSRVRPAETVAYGAGVARGQAARSSSRASMPATTRSRSGSRCRAASRRAGSRASLDAPTSCTTAIRSPSRRRRRPSPPRTPARCRASPRRWRATRFRSACTAPPPGTASPAITRPPTSTSSWRSRRAPNSRRASRGVRRRHARLPLAHRRRGARAGRTRHRVARARGLAGPAVVLAKGERDVAIVAPASRWRRCDDDIPRAVRAAARRVAARSHRRAHPRAVSRGRAVSQAGARSAPERRRASRHVDRDLLPRHRVAALLLPDHRGARRGRRSVAVAHGRAANRRVRDAAGDGRHQRIAARSSTWVSCARRSGRCRREATRARRAPHAPGCAARTAPPSSRPAAAPASVAHRRAVTHPLRPRRGARGGRGRL